MEGFNPMVGPTAARMMKGDDSYMERRNVYDHDTRVIDGTPLGTAVILLAAAGLLVGLKAAGFRFSIGVGR